MRCVDDSRRGPGRARALEIAVALACFMIVLFGAPSCAEQGLPQGCTSNSGDIVAAPPNSKDFRLVARLKQKEGVDAEMVRGWIRDQNNSLKLACDSVATVHSGNLWKFYVPKSVDPDRDPEIRAWLMESSFFEAGNSSG